MNKLTEAVPKKESKCNQGKSNDVIKVNIFQNKPPKQNLEINDGILSDENNLIDTKVPEPEPKPLDLHQTQIKTDQTTDQNENKVKNIFENIKKYDFDIYKNFKQSLKLREKQCMHCLSNNSYYCLDCKVSTCPKCPLFITHNNHDLIIKSPYYECDQKLINDYFSDLDTIFALNPDFMDSLKVKEELKNHVINHVTQLFNKLSEVKTTKLKEIDNMFADTENCVDILKSKVSKMKEDLSEFFEKHKKFFGIDFNDLSMNDSIINNDADEILLNLKEGTNVKAGLIEKNNDKLNSAFLIVYDLMKQSQNVNQEIKYFLNDIRVNREKFLDTFTNKTKIAYETIQKLMQPFDGHFNYQYLANNYYEAINNKLEKYTEKINEIKNNIFEKVNAKGNFEELDRENKIFATYLNQKFETILNNQLIDEDEAITMKSMKTKKSRRNTLGCKTANASQISKQRSLYTSRKSNGEFQNIEKIYSTPEDVVLDKQILQDYFTFETFHLIDKNFRIKPKKNEDLEEEFDEEIDLAKPIANKNEINVYDRKNRIVTKKIVKFDKKIHKYLYFLNGCRTVLIKDKLYIFGGVDKENNVSKVAYVYYINSNELKTMPDMLNPHAYHSVQFLDYYKSIVVVGGENSSSCELYDLATGLWRELPEMNTPRANCILYLDKLTHILYAFFGILGKIAEKNNNYTDVLECLEFRKLALGWTKIEYNNKAEMNFRYGINQIYSLSPEILLVYGGTNMRDFAKRAAVYLLQKQEMLKIDNKIFNEIREASKKSRKLSKILNSTD